MPLLELEHVLYFLSQLSVIIIVAGTASSLGQAVHSLLLSLICFVVEHWLICAVIEGQHCWLSSHRTKVNCIFNHHLSLWRVVAGDWSLRKRLLPPRIMNLSKLCCGKIVVFQGSLDLTTRLNSPPLLLKELSRLFWTGRTYN